VSSLSDAGKKVSPSERERIDQKDDTKETNEKRLSFFSCYREKIGIVDETLEGSVY